MANTKLKRGEVDRWTGNGITNVQIPEANKKAIAEINAQFAKQKGGSTKPKVPAKKK